MSKRELDQLLVANSQFLYAYTRDSLIDIGWVMGQACEARWTENRGLSLLHDTLPRNVHYAVQFYVSSLPSGKEVWDHV